MRKTIIYKIQDGNEFVIRNFNSDSFPMNIKEKIEEYLKIDFVHNEECTLHLNELYQDAHFQVIAVVDLQNEYNRDMIHINKLKDTFTNTYISRGFVENPLLTYTPKEHTGVYPEFTNTHTYIEMLAEKKKQAEAEYDKLMATYGKKAGEMVEKIGNLNSTYAERKQQLDELEKRANEIKTFIQNKESIENEYNLKREILESEYNKRKAVLDSEIDKINIEISDKQKAKDKLLKDIEDEAKEQSDTLMKVYMSTKQKGKTLIDIDILESYLKELDNWRRISNVLGAYGVNREDLENNAIEIVRMIKK